MTATHLVVSLCELQLPVIKCIWCAIPAVPAGHEYISRVVYISRTRYLAHVTDSVPGRAHLIIEILVDEILATQGRTFYWLAKQTGISHTTLWRLKKGKAVGMNLDTLEKMCRALKCEPGDILKLAVLKKNGRNGRTRKKQK